MPHNIRIAVLAAPIAAMVASLFMSVYAEASFLSAAHAINRFILDHFYQPISWVAALALVLLLGLAVSPIGSYRIGGEGAARRLSRWAWVSITLCSTVAMGIMFWGVAEPITHLGAPEPAGKILPNTLQAAQFALSASFFHWSVLPYAIYAFAGLTIALLCQGERGSLSVSGPLQAIFRDTLPDWGRTVIDAVALFALVAGVAASIGTAVLSLSGGLSSLLDMVTTPVLSFAVMAFLVASYLTSSISGLHRGVTLLSDINTKIFLGFMVMIAAVFPPWAHAEMLTGAVGDFFSSFVGKSAVTHEVAQTLWYRDWTTFYLANWYAWAPVTAIFLAFIARGYSVRAFVAVNLVLPSIFACVWLGLLGGAALSVDLQTGEISGAMQAGGAEAALYALLALLPAAKVIVPTFLIMSFLSFVTAADSNLLAIVSICTRRGGTQKHDVRQTVGLKVMWGVLLGSTGWLMVTIAGVDGLRILNSIGGFPALFIMIGYAVALLMWIARQTGGVSAQDSDIRADLAVDAAETRP